MRPLEPSSICAVLLDIEGTTTPISFVFDVLFPYAARNVSKFLAQHQADPKLQPALQRLREERHADGWDKSAPNEIESLAAYARKLMSQDSKLSALKALQGEIWQEGYATGELKGQVFDDVPEALRRWRNKGRQVFIYSSGSVLAQKLIFAHTNHGDLTPLIDGYFDTSVGAKSDRQSYERIAEEIKTGGFQILFVSDSLKELDAAHFGGMHVLLSVRPGNPTAQPSGYQSIRSFDELRF
jgi:enolase-phosphatase E1